MAFLLTTGMAHNVSDLVKHDYKAITLAITLAM